MRTVTWGNEKCDIDSGVYFGRGIFETILIKDYPVLLKEHIDRANEAIIKLNIGDEIRVNDVEKIIAENHINNKALKIVVTERNVIYSLRDIRYKEHHYINGFKVKFSKVLRNSTSATTYIKSLNYLDNILEYEVAQNEGFDEAIFLNEKDEVAEGCTTNIFIVKDNKIFTPSVQCGLLPGVIRRWIIDNFDIEEKIITKDEILNSDEVFLTNSLVGVIKVSEIEGNKFNSKISDIIRKKYNCFINGGSYTDE